MTAVSEPSGDIRRRVEGSIQSKEISVKGQLDSVGEEALRAALEAFNILVSNVRRNPEGDKTVVTLIAPTGVDIEDAINTVRNSVIKKMLQGMQKKE